MFSDDELIKIKSKFKGDWWQDKKIVEKIDDYFAQKEREEKCSHEVGEYTGKKKCCTKCGAYPEKGCFESWSLAGGGFDNI